MLENFLPQLPSSTSETLIYIVAILGAILLVYAVFLETERRQDIIIMLGAFSLMIYAIFIGNLLFTIAMAGLALAGLTEFIEILLGIHKEDKYHLKQLIREGKRIIKK